MAAHVQAGTGADLVRGALSRARAAQSAWRALSARQRLSHLRRMRNSIAQNPQPLLEAIRLTRSGRPDSELLVSEVLPFLDAIRFLELKAEKLLRPVRAENATRPIWLTGMNLEVHREPLGVVLIIAPSNYPLFLPGVQLVQALAAGNAALVKPGIGASPAMLALENCAIAAGIPLSLITILDESPETASDAIIAGVDKIWLTGSATTGRKVAKLASETLTPLVCELSGCDAVILLPGVDPALAARAIAFGLRLNNSQTCMRPHRVLVHKSLEVTLMQELKSRLSELKIGASQATAERLQMLVQDARRQGAIQLQGSYDGEAIAPFILTDVAPDSPLWNADIFAPVLAVNTFENTDQAVQLHNACAYGLTASVFGPEPQARDIAQQLVAGAVVINDLIVPTADPRLPFSGRKQSGYGSSRGAEGLLEFTQPKALSVRRSEYNHLDRPEPSDAAMFLGAISALHSQSLINRFRGALHAVRAALRRYSKSQRSDSHVQF